MQEIEKQKPYVKEALRNVETGDDGVSFFLKILASSLVSFYLVRIFPLRIVDGEEICSTVVCECPDHRYRQVFCKHLGVAFLYFLGEDELPGWQLSKVICTQLRQLRLIECVKVGYRTCGSITIDLKSDTRPHPRWRIKTTSDWVKVLPELLAEIEQQSDVARERWARG